MLEILLGSLMAVWITTEATVPVEPDRNVSNVYYAHTMGIRGADHMESLPMWERVKVRPHKEFQFQNIIRQAYDYSCGSAALTTLLNYYLGRNFQEREIMEGLLEYGEKEKIVARKGFSLLDMKKLVRKLGHPSGGFKASVDDLLELEHPGIVPIDYAGFRHFIVIKEVYKGHVYVADPSAGNISFTLEKFLEIWDRRIIFIIFPNGYKPIDGLALKDQDMRHVDDKTLKFLPTAEMPIYQEALRNRVDNAAMNGVYDWWTVENARRDDIRAGADGILDTDDDGSLGAADYARNPGDTSGIATGTTTSYIHFRRN